MSNIFKIIKSIQKIDRQELPHAEKNLLVSIAIHLGENDHIWPTNEQMGERIGENKDYVKNLLMRLKNKGYLKIEGRGKNRDIMIVEAKIFGNSQLPKAENGNSQLPVGNSQLPPYTKEKEKKKTKEKPLSFQLQELKYTVPKDIRVKTGITYIFKDGIDKMGFDKFKHLLIDMKSQSHIDFIGVLKNRIKTAGYSH